MRDAVSGFGGRAGGGGRYECIWTDFVAGWSVFGAFLALKLHRYKS